MGSTFPQKQTTRREMLRNSAALAGGSFLAQLLPAHLFGATSFPQAQQAPAGDPSGIRNQIGSIPITPQKLTDNLTLLSGPGGNVLVLNGPDGKLIVDTFLSPAWPKLKESLDTLGSAPLKTVINTH